MKRISEIFDELENDEFESELEDLYCPYCGAVSDYVEMFEIEDFEEVELVDGTETDTVEPYEFYCGFCGASWIEDDSGETFEIFSTLDDEDVYGSGIDKKIHVIDDYGLDPGDYNPVSEVKGRRVRKRARRRAGAKKRLHNLKMRRKQNRKSSQKDRLQKRVGGSRTKKVVWRDGKWMVVKKDYRGRVKKERTSNESSLYLDRVKKLDTKLSYNGELYKYVFSSQDCSVLEQLSSKFIKNSESISRDEFIEFIRAYDETHAAQIESL